MQHANRVVLDASAILALLNDESGADQVLSALDRAVVSTVNMSEVFAKLTDKGLAHNLAMDAVQALGIEAVVFTVEHAFACGVLRPLTKTGGLSLGDRACLALAQSLKATVVTADRAWLDVDLQLEIICIR